MSEEKKDQSQESGKIPEVKKEEKKPESTVQKLEESASAFSSMASFDNAQRMAKALCSSDIVPKAYQGNIPNTLVALEMAHRIGISPIFVMQNLDIIQGKPSWRSSFIISALNSSGRFTPLRFKTEGEGDNYGCTAYATDIETGEVVEGVKVDWKMVNAEGWINKNGSKWKTMPELMFRYRSASFFGRLYAPDILTGMHTSDEMKDVNSKFDNKGFEDDKLKQLQEFYESNSFNLTEADREHIERIIKNKESLSYGKTMKALQSKLIS